MLVPTAVREVMHTPVETVRPDESARTAAERLVEAGIGSLVVCENGEPVGIVTDVDVTRLVARGGDSGETTVEAVMSSPLITVGADETVEAAASTMRDDRVKRLPVVDDGSVVGVVTTTDLTAYLPHLVRMGRGEVPDGTPDRVDVRADTAYEDEDWHFEYRGDEASIDVGDAVSFTKTLSAEDVEAFAEASGDTNRLHLDGEYAAATRFGERIVHGTLVAGTVSAALARLPGLTIYLSQDLGYLAPVSIDERVTATCEVVETLGPDRYRLATRVERADGETVLDGEATVMSDPIPSSQ